MGKTKRENDASWSLADLLVVIRERITQWVATKPLMGTHRPSFAESLHRSTEGPLSVLFSSFESSPDSCFGSSPRLSFSFVLVPLSRTGNDQDLGTMIAPPFSTPNPAIALCSPSLQSRCGQEVTSCCIHKDGELHGKRHVALDFERTLHECLLR